MKRLILVIMIALFTVSYIIYQYIETESTQQISSQEDKVIAEYSIDRNLYSNIVEELLNIREYKGDLIDDFIYKYDDFLTDNLKESLLGSNSSNDEGTADQDLKDVNDNKNKSISYDELDLIYQVKSLDAYSTMLICKVSHKDHGLEMIVADLIDDRLDELKTYTQ